MAAAHGWETSQSNRQRPYPDYASQVLPSPSPTAIPLAPSQYTQILYSPTTSILPSSSKFSEIHNGLLGSPTGLDLLPCPSLTGSPAWTSAI